MKRPTCHCFQDPESAADMDAQIHNMGAQYGMSFSEAQKEIGTCPDAAEYTAGAAIVGILAAAAAYQLLNELSRDPTTQQIAARIREIVGRLPAILEERLVATEASNEAEDRTSH